MIKGLFHQEDISFLNVYEPNSRTSKHIKKNLTKLKGEIEKLTIIVGDFNIPSQKLIELDQHTPHLPDRWLPAVAGMTTCMPWQEESQTHRTQN